VQPACSCTSNSQPNAQGIPSLHMETQGGKRDTANSVDSANVTKRPQQLAFEDAAVGFRSLLGPTVCAFAHRMDAERRAKSTCESVYVVVDGTITSRCSSGQRRSEEGATLYSAYDSTRQLGALSAARCERASTNRARHGRSKDRDDIEQELSRWAHILADERSISLRRLLWSWRKPMERN
jgi:hypothetical protein